MLMLLCTFILHGGVYSLPTGPEFLDAVRSKNLDLVHTMYTDLESFSDRDAIFNYQEESTGHSALHVAVQVDFDEFLSQVVLFSDSKLPLDFNFNFTLVDHEGMTAMSYACLLGKDESVKSFLHTKLDLWNISNVKNGWYPIHYAINGTRSEQIEIMDYLFLELAEDTFKQHGFGEDGDEDKEDDVMAKLLDLPHAAQVNFTTTLGQTPLHMASSQNNMEEIIILLQFQPDINAQDVYGNTPLHVAANYADDMGLVVELLEMGGNVNITNNDGLTAKQVARGNSFISEHVDYFDEYKYPSEDDDSTLPMTDDEGNLIEDYESLKDFEMESLGNTGELNDKDMMFENDDGETLMRNGDPFAGTFDEASSFSGGFNDHAYENDPDAFEDMPYGMSEKDEL